MTAGSVQTDKDSSYRPLRDYAIIGDCRSAALVATDGSIDWLCLPRFDSPSIFGGLLDTNIGGRFRIRPTSEFRTERRYVPDTNVLETIFHCAGGDLVLRDLMAVASEEDKRREWTPDHEIIREIEGLTGQVEVEVLYDPRPEYGCRDAQLEERGRLGLWGIADRSALLLRSDVPLELSPDGRRAHGRAVIHPGERAYLSFSFAEHLPAVIPLLGEEAGRRVRRSIEWWQAWVRNCSYQGPYRESVIRSALTLKLLAYAPSGAVVAAPTTSLPEWPGGVRNWDYRYCWLRDAAFTTRALFELGYYDEAEAFVNWMLGTTSLTFPELQVLYDVFGEPHLPERELGHLEGFMGAKPVRIGNAADKQLQLDVYGEAVDSIAQFAARGGKLDRATSRLLNGMGKVVCKRWREPDEGIWEMRTGRAHHTHSKVLCWVALDRLVRLHEHGHIAVSVDKFAAERDRIRADIEAHAYNEQIQSYTRTYDGEDVDASLLLLSLYGYVAPTDPRMVSTCRRVHERLGSGSLLYRYGNIHDGLPPGEGAFGICSFWGAECMAREGQIAEATAIFERLCAYQNDVGLFAEEIDPQDGTPLGNFPQAFTHVGLINAALTLAHLSENEEPRGTA
ncbi:MAG TPA: glycoside hydrolase family 15 protein [Chloroflexota bacterium]